MLRYAIIFESSEEKVLTDGLGWIPGKVVFINPERGLKSTTYRLEFIND
jgi:imidazoleglycerol phosphate synthase glutamine amidotransferase subunit HisH